MVVDEQNPHRSLIGSAWDAEKAFVRHEDRDDYQGWLWGEVLLISLLGATLALFVAYPTLRNTYSLPQVRLVLDTAVTLAGAIVALLAGLRFSVEGRRLDLLLCAASRPRRPRPSPSRSRRCSAATRFHRTEFWGRPRRAALRERC